MTRSTRETIEAFFDATARHDWGLLADLLDEHVEYRAPASLNAGLNLSGRQAALDLLRLGETLYRPGSVTQDRDLLVVEAEYGVCRMTMQGVRTQGASYRNRYVMVYRVRDGRIVEIDEHLDTLYLHQIRMGEAKG